MSFVNLIIEAYESGFTPYPHLTLQQLHRITQHHILDNYQIETKGFSEAWGKSFSTSAALSAKNGTRNMQARGIR